MSRTVRRNEFLGWHRFRNCCAGQLQSITNGFQRDSDIICLQRRTEHRRICGRKFEQTRVTRLLEFSPCNIFIHRLCSMPSRLLSCNSGTVNIIMAQISQTYRPILLLVGPVFLLRSPPLTFLPRRICTICSPFLKSAVSCDRIPIFFGLK